MQKLCDLRNKKELQEYLLTNGLDASDETIEILREQYKNKEKDDNVLTTQQLRDVAGGENVYIRQVSRKIEGGLEDRPSGYANTTHIKRIYIARINPLYPVPIGIYEHCMEINDDPNFHVFLVEGQGSLKAFLEKPSNFTMEEINENSKMYAPLYIRVKSLYEVHIRKNMADKRPTGSLLELVELNNTQKKTIEREESTNSIAIGTSESMDKDDPEYREFVRAMTKTL